MGRDFEWQCISDPLKGEKEGESGTGRKSQEHSKVTESLGCQDGRGRTKWQPNYNLEDTADVKPGNHQ